MSFPTTRELNSEYLYDVLNKHSVGPRVALVDDDPAMRIALRALFRQRGFDVASYAGGAEALGAFEQSIPDVLVTDLRMLGMDGISLLQRCREQYPELPVILLTAHGDVPAAVRAVKMGASEFLLKPPDTGALVDAVREAIRKSTRRASSVPVAPPILGKSASILEACRLADTYAKSPAPVLITGETGAGKELMAVRIHARSGAAGTFVPLHCAAIPTELFESALFGHVRGAFSGATEDRAGAAARAQGGTLFLDEIAEVPLDIQVKLLRFLDSGEFRPVGASEEYHSSARIISATHQDLPSSVRSARFRADLFHRLCVLTLPLPPLRNRPGDAEILLAELLPDVVFDSDTLALLEAHPWPGNVREVRNFAERYSIFVRGDHPSVDEVRRLLKHEGHAPKVQRDGGLAASRLSAERKAVEAALEQSRGNRSKAAQLLGISRSSLYNKLALFERADNEDEARNKT